MILLFKGKQELTKLNINRKKRIFKLTSSMNNYTETLMPWKSLFDKCEYHKEKFKEDNSKCDDCRKVEDEQDKTTEKLSDKDFIQVFKEQMMVYGSELRTVKNGN